MLKTFTKPKRKQKRMNKKIKKQMGEVENKEQIVDLSLTQQ